MDIRPIVKYHGGKGRLHKWIVPLLPSHGLYCEPFGGAASVLLNKPPSPQDVYNDKDYSIYNLLRVVKTDFPSFRDKIASISYDEETYQENRKLLLGDSFGDLSQLEQAVCTYVAKRMSRGGLCGTFCWSSRIYSTGPAEVHCWNTSKDNLEKIHERLQSVDLFHEDALGLVTRFDSKDSLFYLDPPYLASTRTFKKAYNHEMDIAQHEKLASICRSLKGKIAISGYPSDLYKSLYEGWRCEIKSTANHSSQLKNKLTMQECLWLNF